MSVPFVTVELDKVRRLRYTNNNLILFEQMSGKSIMSIMPQTDATGRVIKEAEISLTDARTLLYCGLKWEDRGLTLEKCGDLFDEFGLAFIMQKIGEALNAAFARETENQGDASGEGSG